MKLRELIKVMLFMLCLPNVSKFYYYMKFKNLIKVMRGHEANTQHWSCLMSWSYIVSLKF